MSVCGLALAGLLSACATTSAPVGEQEVRYGRITRIDAVQMTATRTWVWAL
jgi:hypothetical protein